MTIYGKLEFHIIVADRRDTAVQINDKIVSDLILAGFGPMDIKNAKCNVYTDLFSYSQVYKLSADAHTPISWARGI